MLIYEGNIFSEEDCDHLLNSAKNFTTSKLYYTGDQGVKREIISKNQRNSLQYDFDLLKSNPMFSKLNNVLENFGYRLKCEFLLCNIIKYEIGHFIFKHRHDTDGDSFLTFVIQLDNSENYQGGDFLYWLDNKEYKMNRNRGYGAMLSADIEHEVLKVTEGVRHSFVVFIKLNDLENIKSKKIF